MPDFDLERKILEPTLKWLIANYTKRQRDLQAIADLFGEPQALLAEYVEPECQPGNPANEDDDWSDSYWRVSAFEHLSRFLGSQSGKRDGRNHLFLLGDAGMGKTSLLVVLRLFHLAAFFPRHYDCTLLKLDENTEQYLASITGRSRHILLLDALDEDESVRKTSIDARLTQLLDLTQRFHKVIISCRTQFFIDDERDPEYRLGQVRIAGYRCPITYLAPFTQPKIDEFLEKKFAGRGMFGPTGEIETAQNLTKVMGSLRTRPLLLSYIDDLTDMTDEGFVSEYTVYHWLVSKWLEREERKMRDVLGANTPSTETLHAVCTEVAFVMRKSSQSTIEKAAFESIRANFGSELFLDDEFVEGRTLLNKNSRAQYRFAHYSLEEFFAVEHIIGAVFSGADQGAVGFTITDFMAHIFRQYVLQSLYGILQSAPFDYSDRGGTQQQDVFEVLITYALNRGVAIEEHNGRLGSIEFRDSQTEEQPDRARKILGGQMERLDKLRSVVIYGAGLGMMVRQTEVHKLVREQWVTPVSSPQALI